MDTNTYRLREFINFADGHSLVVDTSAGLSLGALPGLEDFSAAMACVLPLADGVVTGPGQARRLAGRTRHDAALLVRADWTNALRGPHFVLPPETVAHLRLLDTQDALDLGAAAMVTYFLLGHEEQVEADCLHTMVQLAISGKQLGLPLIADIHPIGPRVVLYGKAVELGVSYALEGGADGVVVPWPGHDSLRTILSMAAESPVWVKLTQDSHTPASPEAAEALELGATGLWLDAWLFSQPDPVRALQAWRDRVHRPTSVS